jgi:hypothetical protein
MDDCFVVRPCNFTGLDLRNILHRSSRPNYGTEIPSFTDLEQEAGRPFDIPYEIGGVSGMVGFDTMSIRSMNDSITLFQQGFGLVDKESRDYLNQTYDGIFVSQGPPESCV